MLNYRKAWRVSGFLFAFLMLAVIGTLAACSSDSKGQPPVQRTVTVVAGEVTQRTVPLQLKAIATVQTVSTVSVKPLAGGEIIDVHFTEGREVNKGDLLFTIDPRPYEATVRQAEATLAKDIGLVRQAEANSSRDFSQVKQVEANLERDSAQAKNARVQADRYQALLERHLVSQEQYDQMRTNSDSMEATLNADRAAIDNANASARASREAVENAKSAVQADRAILDNAKLQLSYCFIHAPISGRTGGLLVQRGNIVRANDTQSLTVINQMSPVYVVFSLPDKSLPDVRKYMAAGQLKIEANLPNGDGGMEEGSITFIDNAVDNTTGTIQLKGTFANKSKRLWPGQFVNAVLTLTTQSNAIVIPTRAIQTGQQGSYVFVIKQNSTVESRPVTIDRAIDEDSIIAKGLNQGEMVVLDGQLQLVPGAKVAIKKPESTANDRRKPA
jgi:multidrug efflux system membrane fusion protein